MITIYHLEHGRFSQTEGQESLTALPPDTIWVDLLSPTREEQSMVERLLSIEVPTRDEMQEIETSSRLYVEDGALVMTMAVLHRPTSDEPEAPSVTFILVNNCLLTVRYVDPVPFNQFIQRIRRQPSLALSGGRALLGLLEQISEYLADILEGATFDLEGLSRGIFRSNRDAEAATNYSEAIVRIGHIGDLATKAKGSLLNLTRLLLFLAAQSDVDKEVKDRMKTLMQDANSLDEHARFLSAKVSFVLDATLGLINLEQNNIIKMFSVAAVVFLPPTLIASVYGMNFKFLPELDWAYGYPFALLLMVLSAAVPLWFFWRKKWL
ncbi:MAG: magnesium transporter [Proteobacteria bacterium]|jgi:magnesium transporter|nr:magnesium transporter CorA family protein [Alphaproteobacteria bacterium]NCC03887.1 magnesium transporter [Pseudomonadota bacterium]